MILPNDKILIAGAGCFGISTAYHLLKRGYKNVTVIDRATTLPAPDAASQDINKSSFYHRKIDVEYTLTFWQLFVPRTRTYSTLS